MASETNRSAGRSNDPKEVHMHRLNLLSTTLLAAGVLLVGHAKAAAPGNAWLADRSLWNGDRDRGAYDQPRTEGRNSWYGPSRGYRGDSGGDWAIGTFRGQNGANGNEETITIRPDGSAELRSRDQPPKYGTFAGETLTFDSRISKVQPARGGIVIDGAYYRR
jgi:hypothetical protein